jgi:hypothetical protein
MHIRSLGGNLDLVFIQPFTTKFLASGRYRHKKCMQNAKLAPKPVKKDKIQRVKTGLVSFEDFGASAIPSDSRLVTKLIQEIVCVCQYWYIFAADLADGSQNASQVVAMLNDSDLQS